MRSFSSLATALLSCQAYFSLVAAQTSSSCNPTTTSGCPADTALAGQYTWGPNGQSPVSDFTVLSGGSGSVNPVMNKADATVFRIQQSGNGPTIQSDFYIMFGHVELTMRSAPGAGIVSSVVLQSDCLDEIDWEWVGNQDNTVQSNYYSKGVAAYGKAGYHGVSDPKDVSHTYGITWTKESITWTIDGQTVRTVTAAEAGSTYPQTPMMVKLGIWAAGDASLGNAPGTIEWAGGPTNYAAGPFDMGLGSISIRDYSTGSAYTYSDRSGTWQSIEATNGQIGG